MLILSRRLGEIITIDLMTPDDPELRARDLFQHGPMAIQVTRIGPAQVKLGLSVDRRLRVLRSELSDALAAE